MIDPDILAEIRAAEADLLAVDETKITAEFARSSITVHKLALCTFYDFASKAADKFFDALETAKSNAAEQIANAKASLAEKPSLKTLAVARLARRDIEANIARKVTELRKAHKKFVADLESKKLRDDCQAREQAQREADKNAIGDAYKLTPEQAEDITMFALRFKGGEL